MSHLYGQRLAEILETGALFAETEEESTPASGADERAHARMLAVPLSALALLSKAP